MFESKRLHATLAFTVLSSIAATALADGEPDPTFGNGGFAVLDVHGYGTSLVRDEEGNLYFAGTTSELPHRVALAEVDRTGAPVATFGQGGVVYVSLPPDGGEGLALVRDAAGNLYVAGNARDGTRISAMVAKFDANGVPVAAFGHAGIARFDATAASSDVATALVVAADGALVAAGYTSANDSDFLAFKFDANGALVTDFGAGGYARVDFGGSNDLAYRLALGDDGSLLLAGSTSSGNEQHMAVAKLAADGTPATDYGDAGRAVIAFRSVDVADAIAFAPGGSAYVGGFTVGDAGYEFATAKLDANGHLDAGFGDAGSKVLSLGNGASSSAQGVVVERDGRVFFAGYAKFDTVDFVVVAFDESGQLSPGFGDGGVAHYDFGGANDSAGAIALDTGGALDLAGYANTHTPPGTSAVFGAMRILVDVDDRIFTDGFDGMPPPGAQERNRGRFRRAD